MQGRSHNTGGLVSRLITSLLLCTGVLWPLLFALNAGKVFLLSTIVAVLVLGLFILQGISSKMRLAAIGLGAAGFLVLLFVPEGGMIRGSIESIKAITLFLSGVPTATVMFAVHIGVMLAVVSAVLGYAFTSRNMGFVPALLLVMLVMFGLWSMGRHDFLWYSAPALISVLLLISQTSHERSNIINVLPMAAVLVVAGMLIAPGENVVLPKLHKAAMNLKQTISDYLFFSESRKIFSLNDYGYYPEGKSLLGGPVEPGDAPVMIVKTDKKLLLRGVTKETYTGRSWTGATTERRCLYVNPRWQSLRRYVFQEDMPPKTVQSTTDLLDQKAITIQINNINPQKSASTLFVPVMARDLAPVGNLVPYFNESSELFVTRNLVAGDGYTVYAPVLEGGDASLGALINAAPERDSYYESMVQRYTVLPSHLSNQQFMWDDLNTLLSGYNTPYDQACAIMRDLQRRYGYTLTPDMQPEDQDFVTHFLYVGKKGYCTYFASAMTVLCRMAGMPARYVEGFIAQPEEDGFAYVSEKNAHAWTEVYFKGFGWVPFDPTPLSRAGGAEENEPTPTPAPTPTPTPPPPENNEDEPTPTPTPEMDEPNVDEPNPPDIPPEEDKSPLGWIVALLILLLVAGLALWIWQRMPKQMAARKTDAQDKLFVYGNACATLMALKGIAPRKAETPLYFARRTDRQKLLPTPILPLWRVLAIGNYGRIKPGEKQVELAANTFSALFKPENLPTKLRFILQAAFGGKCYTRLETALEHQEPPSPFGKYKNSLEKAAGKSGKKGNLTKKKLKSVKPAARKKPAAKPQSPAQNTQQPPARRRRSDKQ